MTIGANYPTPVTVNGFSCKNCTDVDYAKKHIDPAHPKSGPYGIDAKDDPTVKNANSSIVTFGGNLSGFNANQSTTGTQGAADAANGDGIAAAAPSATIGAQLDVSA
jgi:hypothetical protein